jgi:hypothetical protein
MPDVKNYLLGQGERLTEKLDPPRTKPNKKDTYSFAEARGRIAPRLSAVSEHVDALPSKACPHDETVAVLTLHPTYLAKSYFPTELLHAVGLESIGSRARQIVPEKGAKVLRESKTKKKACHRRRK